MDEMKQLGTEVVFNIDIPEDYAEHMKQRTRNEAAENLFECLRSNQDIHTVRIIEDTTRVAYDKKRYFIRVDIGEVRMMHPVFFEAPLVDFSVTKPSTLAKTAIQEIRNRIVKKWGLLWHK